MKTGNIHVARYFLMGELLLSFVLAIFGDANGCVFGLEEGRSRVIVLGTCAVGLTAAVILLLRDTRSWKLLAALSIIMHALLWFPSFW